MATFKKSFHLWVKSQLELCLSEIASNLYLEKQDKQSLGKQTTNNFLVTTSFTLSLFIVHAIVFYKFEKSFYLRLIIMFSIWRNLHLLRIVKMNFYFSSNTSYLRFLKNCPFIHFHFCSFPNFWLCKHSSSSNPALSHRNQFHFFVNFSSKIEFVQSLWGSLSN